MKTARVFAPAKINLTLHVTGQRADGYHLLDSLVMFADIGDRVSVTPAARTRLNVTGPFADQVPGGADNLVCRAAALVGAHVEIELEKNLPVASGIGGGSSDAAATLRAISELPGHALPPPARILALGADIPVCLQGGLVRMRGIGEQLDSFAAPRELPILLVNPGVGLSTGAVFDGLIHKDNPAMTGPIPAPTDRPAWIGWLAAQRNDLEAPAITIAPAIRTILDNLSHYPGCLLARMSGSGATCFALFATSAERDAARANLQAAHPKWWVAAGLAI